MKQLIILIIGMLFFQMSFSQEEKQEELKEINDKMLQLENKMDSIQQNAKSMKYKINSNNIKTLKRLDAMEHDIIVIALSIDSVSNLIDKNKMQIINTNNELDRYKASVNNTIEKLKKNFRIDLFTEAGILIVLILSISFFIFSFSRKNRHELADLKREVDIEIRTTEKETISEIRDIKEEMKKYKNPEALKHGPAYVSLKEEFMREIEDCKESFISKVNELKDKYERESTYTKERVDKDVMDFKHQIQKEIDELLEKIEGKE